MSKFVVGAYASLPAQGDEQSAYYELLARQPWITGLEIPFPGDLIERLPWLASQLQPHWTDSTITAIPGTMGNIAKDNRFGLASEDETGREAALTFAEQIRTAIHELGDTIGTNLIAHVQLHSAPTRAANCDAFARSLEELNNRDWAGSRLVIEHCDAPRGDRKPEKGFLELADEIAVATKCGVGIHVNWGRSCLEERDAETPLQHINAAGEAGVLRGVLFSGAGPESTQYGYEWIDGHLPHRVDEPTSLMDDCAIARCSAAARTHGAEYLGAKICVPKDSSLEARLAMISRIHKATTI